MKIIYALTLLIFVGFSAFGQGMKLSKTLVVSSSALKEGANPKLLKAQMKAFRQLDYQVYLFQADRGKQKGDYLLVRDGSGLTSHENPFSIFSPELYLMHPEIFTRYELIGADKVGDLGSAGLLGLHHIKVKKDKSAEFDEFVVSKLHPALANLLPDMRLFYFKASDGEKTGSYLLLFAIASTAARDKYWPAGSETQLVKDAFGPLKDLARELVPYLEPGSYLEPESGGGAAIFESKEWTDYVMVP